MSMFAVDKLNPGTWGRGGLYSTYIKPDRAKLALEKTGLHKSRNREDEARRVLVANGFSRSDWYRYNARSWYDLYKKLESLN